MEEERSQLLTLFDFYWFHHQVLLNSPLPSMVHNPELAVAPAAGGESSSTGEPHLQPRHKSGHRRTFSDELALASSSDSALLAHRPPKLQTIFSGKATSEEEVERGAQSFSRTEKEAQEDRVSEGHREKERKHGERRRRMRTKGTSESGKSKSLSELEFEELKGFLDLGFSFSEAEPDQRLLSLVPGLQRLGRRRASSEEGPLPVEAKEGEVGVADESNIPRPYLSEAWGVVDLWESSRRSHAHDHLLRNWRVPAAGEGVDMKDHLRSWAHTVASAVR